MLQLWKKIEEQQVYRGWRGIIKKLFELPDGQIASYDVFDNAVFVTVAALTGSGEFVLIRQFRPGPEKLLLSFVEGHVESGEEPALTAKRELLEETGYEAGAIFFLKERQSAYSNERQLMFLALDCTLTAEPQRDPDEFIEVLTMSPSDLRQMMLSSGDTSFNNIDAAYLAMERMRVLNLFPTQF